MEFAENVKSELDYQGIQIKELASRTGISKNTLDKYLSGKKVQPGVENAAKIARVLGVSVEFLLGNDNSQTEEAKTSNEIKLIVQQYKTLNDFNKQTVRDVVNSLAVRQQKELFTI